MDFQHDIPPLGSVIAIKCAPLKMFYYFLQSIEECQATGRQQTLSTARRQKLSYGLIKIFSES